MDRSIKIKLYLRRRKVTCAILFLLSFAIMHTVFVADWKQKDCKLKVIIVADDPVDVKIYLPPDYDVRDSTPKSNVESINVEVSSGDIMIHGKSNNNLIVIDFEKIGLLRSMLNADEMNPIEVVAVGNVTIYCHLFVLSETKIGEVVCYSMVYAVQNMKGVVTPIFGNFANEKVRTRDCAVWFSMAISLLLFMLLSRVLRITWAERLPILTCTLTGVMFGLYLYAGTGLDILMADSFSTPNILTVLALGSLLHSSFSHLFNDFFLGFLPAGVAFESGFMWKSRKAMAETYLASFFLFNLLITAISYPMHGIPPMGSSYPVISLATVLVSLLFIFRERIVSDAAEKKASARLVILCGFGSYPLLRGIYDWLGYIIEYPTNRGVVGEGASHLMVFAFTLFIAFSAREYLAKQELILGV